MEPHRGRGRLGLRDVRLDTCFGAFGFGRAYVCVCVYRDGPAHRFYA